MGSIRKQLTLWLVAAVVGLFALAAVFCYAHTGAAVERQFDAALKGRARALCALAEREPGGKLEVTPAEASVPEFGDVPHPDYLQILDPAGRTLRRSASLRGQDIAVPSSADAVLFWDLTLPDGRPGRGVRLRFVPGVEIDDEAPADGSNPQAEDAARSDVSADARSDARASPTGSGGGDGSSTQPAAARRADERLTLVLLQDRTAVRRVQKALLSSLLLTSGLLCAGVLVVVPWVVRRGLRGLARVSRQAAQIDASTLSQRLPTRGVPAELRPICERMNDLLARLEGAFARERRFSANVAHELRTPIAELRSLAEVALRWPGDSAAAAQGFEDALAIARQMEAIVTTLLALARCEAGRMPVEFAPVDLPGAVREAWRPLRGAAEARRLEATLDLPDDAIVSADRAMIAAMLSNLLSNAVAYSPPGGTIAVGVRRTRYAVELEVSNTNASLAPEDLGHLLQPFWRKDAARADPSHSGLGLALVAAYARLLGAELSLGLHEADRFAVKLSFPGWSPDLAPDEPRGGDANGAAPDTRADRASPAPATTAAR
jgi:two-component system sensor histidine kinase QseC